MKFRPIESKPMFVVGSLLDAEDAVCWRCMTEKEYLHDENLTLYSHSEFDYPLWCDRCGSPIEVHLTSRGVEALKALLENILPMTSHPGNFF